MSVETISARSSLGRRTRHVTWLALVAMTFVGDVSADSKGDAASKDAEKAALAEFNSLIGGWRGVGQPQRNSSKDSWSETAEWNWHFDKSHSALHYTVKNGKQLETGELTYSPEKKLYSLKGTFSGKVERTYEGKLTGDKLVLDSSEDADGFVHRMTVTRLNDKRTLVLYEKRKAAQNFYARVAEVGYTRQGTTLAIEGAGEPECVVSGGKGTIKVAYKGETYYVCCTGCKQAFDADPEGILADYRVKLAERKKKLEAGKPGEK